MDDRQIIDEFVVESREHLADIESQLLAIENAGVQADPELVNTVFRAVHSVKGAAGFLGFTTVGKLSHDLENVLNLVRNGQLIPDSAVTNVLLRSADQLRTMLDDVDRSNEVDVTDHLTALQAIVAGLLAEESPAAPTASASVASASTPAAFPAQVPTPMAESAPDPAPAPTPVREWVAAPPETPMAQTGPAEPPREEVSHVSSQAAPMQARAADSGQTAQAATVPSSGTTTESNIRVSVTVLDRLMNLAGELVLSRNQLMQTLGSTDLTAMGSVAARVNQVTSELQETIMQTRLQPIGTVFGKFPRVVRDLSATLGKQCELTIEGKEVELDKSIIEAIGDPLTHLIRNAVDHGVERPEDRLRAGKSATGSIALRAFHQAGKVNIQISDDGRGIDAVKLKEKAVGKGLLTPDQAQAMSDREALMLIFRPGFSMAEKVTGVSGRGVGMDVVKTNIERLGGTVTVETELGKGATIHVKLPLTLAIIPSLVVRCGDRRYAIPQPSIRELVRVKAGDAALQIERIKQAEVFRLRGVLLPLVRLADTLDLGVAADAVPSAVHVIVVESGQLRYGMVVDGLCDSEEIVVKPLGRHMKGCTCLAGATVLGDGNVALILDITGIASYAGLRVSEEDAAAEELAGDASAETQSLLLFSNHPEEHFGVPMEVVARLERVRTEQIDSVGGQQILQYRGGTLPLLSLEQCINCKPRPPASKEYVVVFTAAGREVGLIVPELLDIRSVSTQIDTLTFREPGVAGSLVYEQKTIRWVDIHELARKIHPDWYAPQAPPQTPEGSPPRILVAEDSDFFRKQLTAFLESDGYEILACEDGAVAWNALQEPGSHFDLVVTDIEMPNLDGLGLVRNIRKDSRLASIPVIAVTSLAGEDDVRRGREVGVTEYHVKLDREVLMAAVGRMIKASHKKPARSVT